MAIQTVDRVTTRAQINQQLDAIQVPQRLSLFNANTFERTRSIRFGDGTQVAVPAMSTQDQMTAATLFASVSEANRAGLEQLATQMGEAIHDETRTNYDGVQVGSFSAGFTQTVSDVTRGYVALAGQQERDTAVQGMLFMSMVGVEQDLADFAKMVKGKIELASEMRTDIAELQDMITDWPEGTEKQHFAWTEVTYDEDGKMIVTQKEADLTKEEAEELRNKLEGLLASHKDINEMDQFQLQQMTEEYQRAMNTLTGILKAMHDTMKTIIQNTKA